MCIGRKFIKYNNKNLKLMVTNYKNNGRLAILLYTTNDDLYADLTINLSDFTLLGFDEGFINADLDKNIVDILKKERIIDNSYGKRKYNLGQYEFVRFNLDKLKEYDPEGLENSLKVYEKTPVPAFQGFRL